MLTMHEGTAVDLLEEHNGMIRRIAGDVCNNKDYYDDFLQVGRMALIKAKKGYKPSKNVKFSTYAYKTILNNMLQLRKRLAKTKVEMTNIILSDFPTYGQRYEDFIYDNKGSDQLQKVNYKKIKHPRGLLKTSEISSHPDKMIEVMEVIDSYFSYRDLRNRDIFFMRLNGYKLREIAVKFKVSTERISKIASKSFEEIQSIIDKICK